MRHLARGLGHRRAIAIAVTQGSGDRTGGVDDRAAAECQVTAAALEQRGDGDRRTGLNRARKDVAVIAAANRERVRAGLGQDPHRAAADQSRIPCEVFRQRIPAQCGRAAAENVAAGEDGVCFDAPAAEGSLRPLVLVVCDDQLRSDHLGRAALRADDGGDGKLPAGP